MSAGYLRSIPILTAVDVLKRLRSDAYFYIITLLYTLLAIYLAWFGGFFPMLSHDLYFGQWTKVFLIVMPVIAISFDLFWLVHRFDRRRRLAFRRIFSAKRMAGLISGVLLLGGLMFFQGSFTSIKNMLPALRGGFIDDRAQADIDAWLHFGVDPWILLHSVLGQDWARSVIEFNYNVLWFILCFGALFFVATSPSADGIRKRYLLLFAFVWIGCGNILAGLFLSAGPAFYGAVVGDQARFAGLIAFLSRGDGGSSAAEYQTYLWALHESGSAGLGSGISAFPSIHVGLITLNALFLNGYSRRLGVVAFAYVAFIQISSVYLGWHYAIDGYVSMTVVVAAYYALMAFLKRRWERTHPTVTVPSLPVAS
jgi:hypothetical protein